MKTKNLIMIILILGFTLVFYNCSNDDSDDDTSSVTSSSSTTYGSCIGATDASTCLDYTGSNWSDGSASDNCTNQGGTYSSSTCTKTNCTNKCINSDYTGTELLFYTGSADPQTSCDSIHGTLNANCD